ncbi:MAG: hypothetical protein K2M17_02735 [Bacilli bacterium]|nr:hypothetical protein [Bacilli bacterium]
MASFSVHLAIGKRHMEKYKDIADEKAFMKGTVDPDLASNKDESHYTNMENRDNNNLIDYLSKKIQLDQYIIDAYDGSDYQKGIFLHLIADYLFFNDFFDKEYLKRVTYKEFCEDLYFSYNESNNHVEEKYKIDYADFKDTLEKNIAENKKERNLDDEPKRNILENDRIDAFIERVASINLEEYKNKIIENKGNILP